jgi:hypothetical protein
MPRQCTTCSCTAWRSPVRSCYALDDVSAFLQRECVEMDGGGPSPGGMDAEETPEETTLSARHARVAKDLDVRKERFAVRMSRAGKKDMHARQFAELGKLAAEMSRIESAVIAGSALRHDIDNLRDEIGGMMELPGLTAPQLKKWLGIESAAEQAAVAAAAAAAPAPTPPPVTPWTDGGTGEALTPAEAPEEEDGAVYLEADTLLDALAAEEAEGAGDEAEGAGGEAGEGTAAGTAATPPPAPPPTLSDTASRALLLMSRIRPLLEAVFATRRTPASKMLTVRLQDLMHHTSTAVLRVPVCSVSGADMRLLVGHLLARVQATLGADGCDVIFQAYDGESTSIRLGDLSDQPTTAKQGAKEVLAEVRLTDRSYYNCTKSGLGIGSRGAPKGPEERRFKALLALRRRWHVCTTPPAARQTAPSRVRTLRRRLPRPTAAPGPTRRSTSRDRCDRGRCATCWTA